VIRPRLVIELGRLFDQLLREQVGDDAEVDEAYEFDALHGIGWQTGSICDANQVMLNACEQLEIEMPEEWPSCQCEACEEFEQTINLAWLVAIALNTK
jgi:hypothetical protein